MTDTQFKPMLASDWDEKKITFPCLAQPKIDGVRAMHTVGGLTGRSLKKHANKFTTELFSHPALEGFDGEMAADDVTHPNLCTITSSALSSVQGEPRIRWHLFDYITTQTELMPYQERYLAMLDRVRELVEGGWNIVERLRVVPSVECNNMEELLALEELWLDEGYEGVIIRKPDAPFKRGRSTVREGGLLRIKRFIEEEAEVIEIEEGQTNLNEKQTNELGNSFRSTHQENMVPNGQVGSLICRMLKDVFDPQKKDKLLLAKGQIVKVSPGKMTVDQRKFYFQNPHEIVNQIVKFKFFPKGGKDKPRFPTYVSIRPQSDMGGE